MFVLYNNVIAIRFQYRYMLSSTRYASTRGVMSSTQSMRLPSYRIGKLTLQVARCINDSTVQNLDTAQDMLQAGATARLRVECMACFSIKNFSHRHLVVSTVIYGNVIVHAIIVRERERE